MTDYDESVERLNKLSRDLLNDTQLSDEDRSWLANALKQIAGGENPAKVLGVKRRAGRPELNDEDIVKRFSFLNTYYDIKCKDKGFSREISINEASEQFGISPATGKEWLDWCSRDIKTWDIEGMKGIKEFHSSVEQVRASIGPMMAAIEDMSEEEKIAAYNKYRKKSD